MFFKHNYLGIAWAIFILILCGLPGGEFRETSYPSGLDKFIHFSMYGVLVILFIVGFFKQHQFKLLRQRPVVSALLLGILHGLLTEFLQGTVFVDRSIEVQDILTNVGGSLAGVLCFYMIYGNIKN